MMNSNTNNTGRNTIAQVLESAIKDCTNTVKLSELEILETVNLTEELATAKAQVERLESVIAECEDAKAKTEAKAREEKKKEEEFLDSLNSAGKEIMAYLKGLETLATGEKATLVHNIIKAYKKIDNKNLLTVTSNLSAYIAILVREEDRDTIDLLETVTREVYNIKSNYGISAGSRVDQLNDVLLSIQDIY